ncbi:PAS domain S-box-containing protein [Pseudomonas duriflava]|uniref:histidine kinase n=1 Tax=Pseudomonas duriflava TaxID=459528 RepID=A0A562QIM9_9PSED|nr:PAS domain S-box protein [Pseudomonas duriflava]TWI56533.1 PAS domain S-box-containing protein [Pseudomonas duriflava]
MNETIASLDPSPAMRSGDDALWRLICESAVDYAILALDPHSRITAWNKGACKLFGWTAEDMLGSPLERCFTPEDIAQSRPAFEMQMALERGRVSNDRWLMRKDGTRFWANGEMMPLRNEQGEVIGFMKILRDQTARHLADLKTQDVAERLQLSNRATNDAIWDRDLLTDHIDWNEAMTLAYGYRLTEIEPQGDWWIEHIHPDDRLRIEHSLQAAVASTAPVWSDSYRFLRRDGTYADVLDRGYIIRDEHGQATRIVGAMVDLSDLRAVECQLRDSEDRLRLATSAAQLGTYDYRPQNGWLMWDERCRELSGVGPEDPVTYETFLDSVHPDERDRVHHIVQQALDPAGPASFETDYRTTHGVRERWLTIKGRAFFKNGVPIRLIGTVLDITELRQSAERLREAELRLRLALDGARTGVWDIDAVSGTLHWDALIHELVEVEKSEQQLYPDGLLAVVHPDDRARVRAAMQAAILGQKKGRVEIKCRCVGHRTGRTLWVILKGRRVVDADGRIRLIGITRDVTAEHEAEQALQDLNLNLERRVAEVLEERALWADIFETADTMIAAVDPHFTLLAVNRAYAHEFKRRFGQWPRKGHNLLDLLAQHPQMQAEVQAFWTRALAGEEFAIIESLTDAHGERRDYERRYSLLRDHTGAVIGALQSCLDVTERLRAQAHLAEAQELLRQSQKMEAVGHLTGGIAHDFNNLLTGIIGALDLMQRRIHAAQYEGIDRYATLATTSAQRAAALIQRLLAFGRRQSLDLRPVDINQLVAGMEELLRRTLGENITLNTHLSAALLPAKTDANQLENALLNLCINARDAMPHGGQLTIETENVTLHTPQKDLKPGPYVVLSVSDTGTGMPPEVVEKVFDPFFTTKPIGQGSGLGLSMIHGFASQMGGHVVIDSKVGQGTQVRLYMPSHPLIPTEIPTTAETPAVLAAGTGESILVVEDENGVRSVIIEVLKELGYRVQEAVEAKAALPVLESDTPLDLLVTDVGLPGMNGRQLAEKAREYRPNLKILLITGYAGQAVVRQDFLGPGMEMLTKPFSIEGLAAKIRQMLEG